MRSQIDEHNCASLVTTVVLLLLAWTGWRIEAGVGVAVGGGGAGGGGDEVVGTDTINPFRLLRVYLPCLLLASYPG